MKNYELKTTLLSNLEECGRELIERGIRTCDNASDLYLFYDNDGNIDLRYDYFGNYINELYNFKNYQDEPFFKYKQIHKELLESGNTKEESFDKWFDNECCLDSEIETIYELVENTINEIF